MAANTDPASPRQPLASSPEPDALAPTPPADAEAPESRAGGERMDAAEEGRRARLRQVGLLIRQLPPIHHMPVWVVSEDLEELLSLSCPGPLLSGEVRCYGRVGCKSCLPHASKLNCAGCWLQHLEICGSLQDRLAGQQSSLAPPKFGKELLKHQLENWPGVVRAPRGR